MERRKFDREFKIEAVRPPKLTRAGVDAELYLLDGLGHAFFKNPDSPESKEAYAVIVDFFDRHLGH